MSSASPGFNGGTKPRHRNENTQHTVKEVLQEPRWGMSALFTIAKTGGRFKEVISELSIKGQIGIH